MLFSLFSGLGLACIWLVINTRNDVNTVLYLVLVYCNVSGMLLLLEVEYLGLLLLIVYVGAVVILFLFIIMMLAPRESYDMRGSNDLSVLCVGLVGGLFVNSLIRDRNNGSIMNKSWNSLLDRSLNVEEIGEVLYSEHILEVLSGGLVLLIALIGAIKLTR